MVRLPERPNFEHLKKQAKDLLRLYEAKDATAFTRFRESLPAARGKDDAAIIAMELALHDAQSCIAREYNLPSWEALRKHVDWRNSRRSRAPVDVVLRWLRMVYGHREDRPEPALAARAYAEEPELAKGELFLACAVGDEAEVRRAIAADPSCVNETGSQWLCPDCQTMLDMPPLVAVTHSSLLMLPQYRDGLRRCARLLLDHGADPNQRWSHGEHPLSALYGAAGKNFDPELTRLLLDAGAEPNDGESLYHSIDARDHACTRLLLEAGARPELANAVAKQLDYNDVEGLALILKYAKGVEDRELIWAIRRGRSTDHIALLLTAGANPQAKTKDGLSAYRYALQCGLREVAKLLEEAGAGEALSIAEQFVAACAAADDRQARQILADHPGIVGQLSEGQLRQLPELTEAGHHRAVRLMVELGWPIAVRGGDWAASPLNLAVYQGNQALARFLMERGASWAEVHGFGGNVCGTLAWASRNRTGHDSIGCARALLDHGAPLLDANEHYSEELEKFLAEERARRRSA